MNHLQEQPLYLVDKAESTIVSMLFILSAMYHTCGAPIRSGSTPSARSKAARNRIHNPCTICKRMKKGCSVGTPCNLCIVRASKGLPAECVCESNESQQLGISLNSDERIGLTRPEMMEDRSGLPMTGSDIASNSLDPITSLNPNFDIATGLVPDVQSRPGDVTLLGTISAVYDAHQDKLAPQQDLSVLHGQPIVSPEMQQPFSASRDYVVQPLFGSGDMGFDCIVASLNGDTGFERAYPGYQSQMFPSSSYTGSRTGILYNGGYEHQNGAVVDNMIGIQGQGQPMMGPVMQHESYSQSFSVPSNVQPPFASGKGFDRPVVSMNVDAGFKQAYPDYRAQIFPCGSYMGYNADLLYNGCHGNWN